MIKERLNTVISQTRKRTLILQAVSNKNANPEQSVTDHFLIQYEQRCRLQNGNKSKHKTCLPQTVFYFIQVLTFTHDINKNYCTQGISSPPSPPHPTPIQKKSIYIFKLEKVNGNLQAKENQIHILFTFLLFTGQNVSFH